MTPFATAEDYEARFGPVGDEKRLNALLTDATAFLMSLGVSSDDSDEVKTATLKRVTCAMVHRSMVAGDYEGLSNVSQGAGGYTESATIYNPGGDLYLTKAEKEALGIGGCSFGVILPEIDRGCLPCQ